MTITLPDFSLFDLVLLCIKIVIGSIVIRWAYVTVKSLCPSQGHPSLFLRRLEPRVVVSPFRLEAQECKETKDASTQPASVATDKKK